MRANIVPRVPQCMSPLPNWDPSTPSPASECVPPPRNQGGDTRLRVRRWGSPFGRLEKKLSTLSTVAGTVRKVHQREIFLGSDFYFCFFIVINAS